MLLRGEPFKGRVEQWQQGEDREKILQSSGRDRVLGGWALRSLRGGWGSRGFVSYVGLDPVPNEFPCATVSQPAVLSLQAWDMLTQG